MRTLLLALFALAFAGCGLFGENDDCEENTSGECEEVRPAPGETR